MAITRDIRESVRAELSFDPLVDETFITVKNLNGDVALNGSVSSYPQYLQAATAARRDDIEIFSEAEAADVTDLVQDALDRYALIDEDSEVRVAARDGGITLTGHVATWAEHDAVVGAAWMGIGVSSVNDELLITG